MNNTLLTNPWWTIGALVVLILATRWVASRYNKAAGAYGLVALAVLPYSLLGLWHVASYLNAGVTLVVTAIFFLIGQLVDKKWDDVFHLLALGCSLFLPPVLGSFFMGVTVPFGVVVVSLIVLAIAAGRWRKRRKVTRTQSTQQPAADAAV